MAESSKDQPKQSNSTKKTTGSKDAKALAHNKNRSLEAPDMPDLTKEKAIVQSATHPRGHGAYSDRVREQVLALAEQGWSLSKMPNIAGVTRKRAIPHRMTLYRWRREDPDFDDEFRARYKQYVDDQARQMLHIVSRWGTDESELAELIEHAKRLPKLKGLKPAERVEAVNKMIQRVVDLKSAMVNAQEKRVAKTLLIAGKQLSDEWGDNVESGGNMVVIDMNLDMDKKTDLPGSTTGQNAAALLAMRNVTPHAT
jgi:hypothetical protein